ncbi:MAG TPA: SDR family oxidoreductase [Candidatus Merdenecus merdavium]|nr:SDR family oxidoreductase [Candidatus Merdenecus merdavium]
MGLFDFKGKVAVITGASSGLGADAARAFAEHGADVAILARRKEKLESLAEEINSKKGGRAFYVSCDVSKEESVKEAVDAILAHYGKIHILVNNAGVANLGTVETMSTDEWDYAININLKGIIHMCKYVVPSMRQNKYGRIINISSVNAFLADKPEGLWRHAYNTTKAGVIGLTKGMAASYTQENITANAVCPGLFESEMTSGSLFQNQQFMGMYQGLCPASRPGAKGELNSTLLYFASEASGYVSGQSIIIDGGFSIV